MPLAKKLSNHAKILLMSSSLAAGNKTWAINVALPLPLEGSYTYSVSLALEVPSLIGKRVLVPFQNREIVGFVVSEPFHPEATKFKLKSILKVLDETPVITPDLIDLGKKISDYYVCGWGEALENILPRWVKYGRSSEASSEIIEKSILPAVQERSLTPEQKNAFQQITESLSEISPKPVLLWGVTGSGKTELYIRTAQQVLLSGKDVICLVPEIALTEQLKHFFIAHFGNTLEVLHSKLTDLERSKAWRRIERGEKKVILGPRSAVFAPVQKLGLIIIDEEHETSYKQETAPRYHAREVARWRTQQAKALLIAGSATPSLETIQASKVNEVKTVVLNHRIDKKPLPKIQVVDLKNFASPGHKAGSLISPPLRIAIKQTLEARRGIMILLNRRGFSTFIHCPSCGNVEICKSCEVSLTYHQESGFLLCHYCNLRRPVPEICSFCSQKTIRFSGFGTEKVESEIAKEFPQARISRLDSDTIKTRGSHEKILDDFRNKRSDILIGTQMIAKGFDFPHVTLVGIILADVGLQIPDFRSSERNFQLMVQVAGRSGRGEHEGKVMMQTYLMNHPAIQAASRYATQDFYEGELNNRRDFFYPPFARLTNIILRSKNEQALADYAATFKQHLLSFISSEDLSSKKIEIIGPAPLPFVKLRGHYRWHILVKSHDSIFIQKTLSDAARSMKKSSRTAFAIDVDPISIL